MEETIMVKNEDFYKIKEIFAGIDEVDLHQRHGGKFHFPIYMTEKLEQTDIEVLELSVRSYNCLKRAGISTIGQLCSRVHGSEDLKSIRNCGKTSVAEIMDSLFAYQYAQLNPERRGKFLATVIEMNVKALD